MGLPEEDRLEHSLSTLRTVWHLAEPCPQWLKLAWIEWLGPDVIAELYGGTEGIATTMITGRDWLEHRGSVGRAVTGEIMVGTSAGVPIPAHQIGEVWMRAPGGRVTYRYRGAEPRRSADGWESLGDLGFLDEEGYLYLTDRSTDVIVSGGANIYPAEVETAVLEHPAVLSCLVIGLPDVDRGERAHAIVQADPGHVSISELEVFVQQRLVRYKVPRTWEFVESALRSDAGKSNRGALRAARIVGGGLARP